MISRSTLRAIDASSGATSRVTMRAIGAFGQAIDQAVADFAAGAGDEDDRFAHLAIIPAAIVAAWGTAGSG